MIEVKVQHNMASFVTELTSAVEDIKDKVMVRAINKMADQVKVAASRAVRDAGYKLAAADIKRQIKINYANRSRLRAEIVARGRPIPLYQYGARQVGSGVSVSVKSGRKVIQGAFIAKMPSGHVGVFVREPNAKHRKVTTGAKPSWHALPIRELFGPSIPDAVGNQAVQDALQQLIVEKFPKILDQENRWAQRSARR